LPTLFQFHITPFQKKVLFVSNSTSSSLYFLRERAFKVFFAIGQVFYVAELQVSNKPLSDNLLIKLLWYRNASLIIKRLKTLLLKLGFSKRDRL
jgi:hypothetical protein